MHHLFPSPGISWEAWQQSLLLVNGILKNMGQIHCWWSLSFIKVFLWLSLVLWDLFSALVFLVEYRYGWKCQVCEQDLSCWLFQERCISPSDDKIPPYFKISKRSSVRKLHHTARSYFICPLRWYTDNFCVALAVLKVCFFSWLFCWGYCMMW